MSRLPFDPDELDEPTPSSERAIAELERYAKASQSDAPHGLAGRIMVAIQGEPAPRRGFLAWLLTPASTGGGPGRFVRAGALAATLVLAVAGALFAGQLADFVRDVGGNPTPTPSISPSPSEAPSFSPAPSSSVEPSLSSSPQESDDHGASQVVPTALPTPNGTANATHEDSAEESKTATP